MIFMLTQSIPILFSIKSNPNNLLTSINCHKSVLNGNTERREGGSEIQDSGRQPEIAMAAYKPEVVITQKRYEISTRFQRC